MIGALMSSLLFRLGRWCARHGGATLAAWGCVILLLAGSVFLLGGKLANDYTIPGTEAQQGIDTLATRLPEMAGASGELLFTSGDGPVSADRAQIESALEKVRALPDVAAVSDPFGEGAPISKSGSSALAQIQLRQGFADVSPKTIKALQQIADKSSTDGLKAQLGGRILATSEVKPSLSEAIGLGASLLVLVLTLGSLLAAGMPILVALTGVGVSMLCIFLLAGFMDVATSTPSVAVMLGLAVGIDYSLFILSRHRSHLAEGIASDEAAGRAIGTAGSAVVFAGLTVIVALLGLSVSGIPFLTLLGIAAALAVAAAVVVSLTLLPALLGFAGNRLRPKEREASTPSPASRFYAAWVGFTTGKPWLTIFACLLIVTALALPAKDLRLGPPDNGSLPAENTARQVFDAIDNDFGPGYNGPLVVTADIINSTDPLKLVSDLKERVSAVPGIAHIQLATPNRGADLAVVVAIPQTGPSTPESTDLVHRIRAAAPGWEKSLGLREVLVTGATAQTIDMTERLTKALVPFGVMVVGLCLLLLSIVFRSLWVPVKAAAGYLLSLAAAFGVTAMVFSYGWGAPLLGVHSTNPINPFMPIMVMGVLFGLAMDYEVFLVSRMREEYAHGRPDPVRDGFRASAAVVTAAALIMVSVFITFVPESAYEVQPIALALAAGILVDAFLVRMSLVPAVLTVLGERAWRLPNWLPLPRVDIEGEGLERYLELSDGPEINLRELEVPGGHVSLAANPGDVIALSELPSPARRKLALVLTGRAQGSGDGLLFGHSLSAYPAQARALIGADFAACLAAPKGCVVVGDFTAEQAQELADKQLCVLQLGSAHGGPVVSPSFKEDHENLA
ncbi:MMPL family transporter [Dermabacteraceae bacterium P13095]